MKNGDNFNYYIPLVIVLISTRAETFVWKKGTYKSNWLILFTHLPYALKIQCLRLIIEDSKANRVLPISEVSKLLKVTILN